MKVEVYDTYVTRKDGKEMHFDVLLDQKTGDNTKATAAARKYLDFVGEKDAKCTTKECSYCHVQDANAIQEELIKEDGYYILKMGDNCL